MGKPSSLRCLCLPTFFLPSDETEEGVAYRVRVLNDINTQILFMVYYGHFSFGDCENMTSQELKWFYEGLLEIQRKEADSLKGLKS